MGKGEEDVLDFSQHSRIPYPIVPGHEIAGFVDTLGGEAAAAGHVTVGDRVVVYPWIGCGQCPVCVVGDGNFCPVQSKELGFCVDGGYSEYVMVSHHRYILKLPDAIPFPVGALLPCSGLTAYSAIQKCRETAERVRRWERGVVVAVIGLGGLGQWALRLLPFCLGKEGVKVIGIDVSAKKAQTVKDDGLVDETLVLSLESPMEEQAKSIGKKPDIVLDFVNSAETFSLSVQLLAKVGIHVMVGLYGGQGALKLPLTVLNGCTHVGNLVGSLGQLRELLELVAMESIPFPSVKRYELSEAGQALKDLERGLVPGRAVLDMQCH